MPNQSARSWVITGGAGYIGAHVVQSLRRSGRRVVVIDDLSSGLVERLPPDVQLVRASLLDVPGVEAVLRAENPEGVIHLAAKKSPTESVADPLKYASENVGGLIALLSAMRSAEVGRLVFSSSCSVYGDVHGIAIDENAPMLPVSPYGESKAYGEQLLMAYSVAGGPRVVALRYFNVAGAGSRALRDRSRVNLLPNVLAAATSGDAVEVFGVDYDTPDGTCVRDYVDVRDLAEAHVAAAASIDDGAAFRVYNVGAGSGVSVLRMIAAASSVTGAPIRWVRRERRPGDPSSVVADVSLIGRELGWRAEHALEATVASAWAALDEEGGR